MTSYTFGPVGLLHRGRIRDMAVCLGVTLVESRGLVSSVFRADGAASAVGRFADQVRKMAADEAAYDHQCYVREMERVEKRRVRRAGYFGRNLRLDRDFTRKESADIHALMREALIARVECTDEALERLTTGLREIHKLFGMAVHDETISTIADVRLRYLQNDVCLGDIRLPKALRARVLAVRPHYDTWSE